MTNNNRLTPADIEGMKARIAADYVFTTPGDVVVSPYTDMRRLIAEVERLRELLRKCDSDQRLTVCPECKTPRYNGERHTDDCALAAALEAADAK